MIQAHKFSNGSYVGHRVRINSNISTMKYSVWFSAEGELLDCEGIDARGRSRPVSPKIRKILSTMFGWIVAASRQA